MNIEKLQNKRLKDFTTNVNWSYLVNLIVYHYIESGIGNLKIPVETMIRVYFLQLKYELSAAEAAIALSKIDVLKEFTLIDTNTDVLPNSDNINDFKSLIQNRKLESSFLDEFNICV